ncbi:MAG: hypothetical protein OXI96_08795 [Acidimicrobiaceae bacterium]|nr:hypothetical protein [Acidimicrobiaceae bacterium]
MESTTKLRSKLFETVVDETLQHPLFREIAANVAHMGARTLMQQTFEQWDSPDRQFVRDFQTEGFDARVFELYLAATLDSLGWTVGAESDRPDFRCLGSDLEFYVEAATAHSPGNPKTPTSPDEYYKELLSATDNFDEVAVRFGSVLRNKAKKAYQDLPHVAGKPIVIAIQGFFGAGVLFHTETPLIRYLYDLVLTEIDESGTIYPTDAPVGFHIGDSKTIKSDWFHNRDAAYISAVMWSNSGTVAKFNRMAASLGLGAPGWEIHRFGTELDPQPGATKPVLFVERVEPCGEPWEEGLVIMHNPRAKVPLPLSAFEGMTQIRQVDNTLREDLRGRKIYNQRSFPHREVDRSKILEMIDVWISGIEWGSNRVF